MRYFIEIGYHGKNYHGWQSQPNQITVQEVLEKALSTLLRAEIKVVGAGRTDAGVHAKQLYAHFDCERISGTWALPYRLNSFLPWDITVKSIQEVTADAHARFHAVEREYDYVITLNKNPFLEGLAYHIHNVPDITLMNRAAKMLLSHNDFQCFSRSNTDVKTYFCDLKKAEWLQCEDQLIFTIAADRFLRNMVRAIVGTLLDIGLKKTPLSQLEEILESKDRRLAGASAPAHGLYLTNIKYPSVLFNTK